MRKFFGSALMPFVLLAGLLLAGAAAAQDEDIKPALQLPQGAGAWLLEASRDGGMRPSTQSVTINSDGEVAVFAVHQEGGGPVVDCSIKVKLSAEDLRKLKEAVRAAKPASWRDGYSDKKHPICCDQPTTDFTLRWRDAGGAERTLSTSWYPGSSELRPGDLAAVAEATDELWNKARERCAAGEANE